MSNKAKELRGSLRIVVKEILPELLIEQQYEILEKKVMARLDGIEKYVKAQMKEMSESHKDTLTYLVRSTTRPAT